VTDPDIRHGSQLNMFPSISDIFLRWRGPKSTTKLDEGPWPDFLPGLTTDYKPMLTK